MKCSIFDWPFCEKETTNENGICSSCAKDGWIGGKEMINEIAKDEELSKKIAFKSPLEYEK